jgi:hypothetical protein
MDSDGMNVTVFKFRSGLCNGDGMYGLVRWHRGRVVNLGLILHLNFRT